MFAIMPQPTIFRPFDTPQYQPSASSPLSSSPIRASSPSSPPPLPSRDTNIFLRPSQHSDTQSSPIAPSCSKPLFKYATRTPRPNPVVQRREDAQASRRRLFLKNVRDRSDDQSWERRGGEQELLKLEWWRLTRELRQQKESELANFIPTDADIDDAARIGEEINHRQQPDMDVDDMMADAIAQEEEAELEALLSSMPRDDMEMQVPEERQPDSPHFSEDEDYDALFVDLLIQQGEQGGVGQDGDTEMS